MDDREGFLTALEAEPLDHLLRCVYADWLDEQGEVEEATRQRGWVAAYEFLLKNFVNPYWEEDYEEPPGHDEVMEALDYWQRSLVEHEGICFNTDQAASNIYDEEKHPEFFRSLEIVTGKVILPETRERASFRCAC